LSLAALTFNAWLANGAALQTVNKPFPQWPALFFELVLKLKPLRPKYFFSNVRVTHPIAGTLISFGLRPRGLEQYQPGL